MSAKLQRLSWCQHCGQGLWDWSRKPKLYCSKSCRWEGSGRRLSREYQRRHTKKKAASPEYREQRRQYARRRRAAWTAEQWEAERERDRKRTPVLLEQARQRRARKQPERVAAIEDQMMRKALEEAIREVLKPRPPPPPDRPCQVCGEMFTPTRRRRNCSDACMTEANRDRARARGRWLREMNPGHSITSQQQQTWKAEAPILREHARHLREQGWSVVAIARELNRCPETIREYLTSPAHWRRDAGTMAS